MVLVKFEKMGRSFDQIGEKLQKNVKVELCNFATFKSCLRYFLQESYKSFKRIPKGLITIQTPYIKHEKTYEKGWKS